MKINCTLHCVWKLYRSYIDIVFLLDQFKIVWKITSWDFSTKWLSLSTTENWNRIVCFLLNFISLYSKNDNDYKIYSHLKGSFNISYTARRVTLELCGVSLPPPQRALITFASWERLTTPCSWAHQPTRAQLVGDNGLYRQQIVWDRW